MADLNFSGEILTGRHDEKPTAVIVGPVYPFRGGISLFLGHVHEALVPFFNLRTISFLKLYPKFLFPGTTELDKSARGLKEVRGARFVISSTNPLTWFKAWRIIARMKPRPEILIFSWWNPFFAMLYAFIAHLSKLSTGCRVLYFCENLVSHESRIADRMLTRIGLSPADMIIVLSKDVENAVAEFAPDKPVSRAALPVYNCFKSGEKVTRREARGRLGLPENGSIMLFFGYIRKYKGLDYLLDAFPGAAARVPGLELLIVGEFYEPRKKYDRRIASLGISKAVRIIDRYVDNDEVETFFRAADLVVLPYVSATQSGIARIAAAFDAPVLSTRVGGLAEEFEEGRNGLLVPPADSAALSSGIVEFFESDGFGLQEGAGEKAESRIATLVRAAVSGDPEGLFRKGRGE